MVESNDKNGRTIDSLKEVDKLLGGVANISCFDDLLLCLTLVVMDNVSDLAA
jgi:hypothetical protein